MLVDESLVALFEADLDYVEHVGGQVGHVLDFFFGADDVGADVFFYKRAFDEVKAIKVVLAFFVVGNQALAERDSLFGERQEENCAYDLKGALQD